MNKTIINKTTRWFKSIATSDALKSPYAILLAVAGFITAATACFVFWGTTLGYVQAKYIFGENPTVTTGNWTSATLLIISLLAVMTTSFGIVFVKLISNNKKQKQNERTRK